MPVVVVCNIKTHHYEDRAEGGGASVLINDAHENYSDLKGKTNCLSLDIARN